MKIQEKNILFLLRECQKAINAYTDMRSRYDEKLDDNSHLLREQFDYRDSFAIKNPRKVTDKLLRWKLMMMAEKCGIRKRGYDKTKRQGINDCTWIPQILYNTISTLKSKCRDKRNVTGSQNRTGFLLL